MRGKYTYCQGQISRSQMGYRRWVSMSPCEESCVSHVDHCMGYVPNGVGDRGGLRPRTGLLQRQLASGDRPSLPVSVEK